METRAPSSSTMTGWLHIVVVSGRKMPNLDVLRAMDPYVVAWVEPFREFGVKGNMSKSFRAKVSSLVSLEYRRPRGDWKPSGTCPRRPRNFDRTNTLFNRGGNPDWSEESGDTCHLKVWVADVSSEVLYLEAWDEDKFTPDECIGVTEVDLRGCSSADAAHIHNEKLLLPSNPKKKRGTLQFRVWFRPAAEETDDGGEKGAGSHPQGQTTLQQHGMVENSAVSGANDTSGSDDDSSDGTSDGDSEGDSEGEATTDSESGVTEATRSVVTAQSSTPSLLATPVCDSPPRLSPGPRAAVPEPQPQQQLHDAALSHVTGTESLQHHARVPSAVDATSGMQDEESTPRPVLSLDSGVDGAHGPRSTASFVGPRSNITQQSSIPSVGHMVRTYPEYRRQFFSPGDGREVHTLPPTPEVVGLGLEGGESIVEPGRNTPSPDTLQRLKDSYQQYRESLDRTRLTPTPTPPTTEARQAANMDDAESTPPVALSDADSLLQIHPHSAEVVEMEDRPGVYISASSSDAEDAVPSPTLPATARGTDAGIQVEVVTGPAEVRRKQRRTSRVAQPQAVAVAGERVGLRVDTNTNTPTSSNTFATVDTVHAAVKATPTNTPMHGDGGLLLAPPSPNETNDNKVSSSPPPKVSWDMSGLQRLLQQDRAGKQASDAEAVGCSYLHPLEDYAHSRLRDKRKEEMWCERLKAMKSLHGRLKSAGNAAREKHRKMHGSRAVTQAATAQAMHLGKPSTHYGAYVAAAHALATQGATPLLQPTSNERVRTAPQVAVRPGLVTYDATTAASPSNQGGQGSQRIHRGAVAVPVDLSRMGGVVAGSGGSGAVVGGGDAETTGRAGTRTRRRGAVAVPTNLAPLARRPSDVGSGTAQRGGAAVVPPKQEPASRVSRGPWIATSGVRSRDVKGGGTGAARGIARKLSWNSLVHLRRGAHGSGSAKPDLHPASSQRHANLVHNDVRTTRQRDHGPHHNGNRTHTGNPGHGMRRRPLSSTGTRSRTARNGRPGAPDTRRSRTRRQRPKSAAAAGAARRRPPLQTSQSSEPLEGGSASLARTPSAQSSLSPALPLHDTMSYQAKVDMEQRLMQQWFGRRPWSASGTRRRRKLAAREARKQQYVRRRADAALRRPQSAATVARARRTQSTGHLLFHGVSTPPGATGRSPQAWAGAGGAGGGPGSSSLDTWSSLSTLSKPSGWAPVTAAQRRQHRLAVRAYNEELQQRSKQGAAALRWVTPEPVLSPKPSKRTKGALHLTQSTEAPPPPLPTAFRSGASMGSCSSRDDADAARSASSSPHDDRSFTANSPRHEPATNQGPNTPRVAGSGFNAIRQLGVASFLAPTSPHQGLVTKGSFFKPDDAAPAPSLSTNDDVGATLQQWFPDAMDAIVASNSCARYRHAMEMEAGDETAPPDGTPTANPSSQVVDAQDITSTKDDALHAGAGAPGSRYTSERRLSLRSTMSQVTHDSLSTPNAGLTTSFAGGYGHGAPAFSPREPQPLRFAYWRQPGFADHAHATAMQRVVRGYLVRRRIHQAKVEWTHRRIRASTVVGAACRSWLARRAVRLQRVLTEMEREAANSIIRFWRAAVTRRLVTRHARRAERDNYLAWSKSALVDLPQDHKVMAVAATNLQALWRGHKMRRAMRNMRSAVIAIQSIFRGQVHRALRRAAEGARRRVRERKLAQAGALPPASSHPARLERIDEVAAAAAADTTAHEPEDSSLTDPAPA